MANIIINDILDELREENNRLFNENKRINELLDNYRKCLTFIEIKSFDLQNVCKCSENSRNQMIIEYIKTAANIYLRTPFNQKPYYVQKSRLENMDKTQDFVTNSKQKLNQLIDNYQRKLEMNGKSSSNTSKDCESELDGEPEDMDTNQVFETNSEENDNQMSDESEEELEINGKSLLKPSIEITEVQVVNEGSVDIGVTSKAQHSSKKSLKDQKVLRQTIDTISRPPVKKSSVLQSPQICIYCHKSLLKTSRSQKHQGDRGWYHRKCGKKFKYKMLRGDKNFDPCLFCEKDYVPNQKIEKRQSETGQSYHNNCYIKYKYIIRSLELEKNSNGSEAEVNQQLGTEVIQLEDRSGLTNNQSSKPTKQACSYCGEDCVDFDEDDKQQDTDGQWYHIYCKNEDSNKTMLAEKGMIEEQEMRLRLKISLANICSADKLKDSITSAQNTNEVNDKEINENPLDSNSESDEEMESREQTTDYKSTEEDKSVGNRVKELNSSPSVEKGTDHNSNEVSEQNEKKDSNELNPGIDLESSVSPEELRNKLEIDSWEWLKVKNMYKHLCPHEGCGRRFAVPSRLQNHIRTQHTFEKPFKCEECDERFFTNRELAMHLRSHMCERDPELRVKCDFKDCEKYFSTHYYMRRHKRRNHSMKRWTCDWPECGRVYKEKKSFDEHKRRHLGVREFKCNFEGCAKQFFKKQTLDKHFKTHSKRFVCSWPECNDRFALKDSLTSHLNKHKNIKPFKCTFSGCEKAFYGQPQLSHHNWSFHRDQFESKGWAV